MMFSSSKQIAVVSVFLLAQSYLTTANTEIINFSAVEREFNDVELEDTLRTLPALNSSNNEQYFRIQPAPLYTPLKSVCNSEASASKDESGRRPDGRTDIETLAAALHSCPHQLWTILDLDSHEWAHFSRFTLRVSWPAFHPADFDVMTFTGPELVVYLNVSSPRNASKPSRTRRMYAVLRLVDTGVRTPSKEITKPSLDSSSTVPFIITLEPLYLGFIPASVLPTLALLTPVVLCVSLLVPHISRYLGSVAADAKRQLDKKYKKA